MSHGKLILVVGAVSCLWGCLGAGVVSDSRGSVDTFPRPIGDKIIPLEKNRTVFSTFRWRELDSLGRVFLRMDDLHHQISLRGELFGYAFEDLEKGILLWWRDTPGLSRDSVGIYVIGTFDKNGNVFGDTALWFPQFPNLKKWRFHEVEMELISPETTYYTETVLRGEPNRHGFQSHKAVLIKESFHDTAKAQDVITFYYLQKGVGILGMERSINGRLAATGIIRNISERDPMIYPRDPMSYP